MVLSGARRSKDAMVNHRVGRPFRGHCRERETSGKAEHGRPLMVEVLY